MKLWARFSILIFVVISAFFGITTVLSQTRKSLSPCAESVLCFWSSEVSPNGDARLTTHTALSINSKKLSSLLGAIDSFHGAMLAQSEEFEDDFLSDPNDTESTDTVSLEHEQLFQRIADDTWNSGALAVRGTLTIEPNSLYGIPFALGRLFLRDTDFLESLIAIHFPAMEQTFADFPFSELSRRENMPPGIHHYLAQVAVFDFFTMYDNLCANSAATPLCDWLDENNYGPLPLFEVMESFAGSEAVLHINLYWSIRNGQILWANTLEALTTEASWEPLVNRQTVEQWPTLNTPQETAIKAQGFSANLHALRDLWASVLDTTYNLASQNTEWQGFLAFPDLGERLEALTDVVTSLPPEPEFSVSLTAASSGLVEAFD